MTNYREAIALFRQTASPYSEADALLRLGEVYASTGDSHEAERAWYQALDMLTGLRHPTAERVRIRIGTARLVHA